MLIAEDGVEALTMRALAARLGVVPGALYRHVRSKEQLQDLILDGVLAEVDCDINHALPWTEQIKAARSSAAQGPRRPSWGRRHAQDSRPTRAALPCPGRSLPAPLHDAGFSHRDTGLAYFLILGYTVGFEVSSTRISVNEQRVQDAATRKQLHEFFRSLPDDRFPTLVALGEHVWLDNRDERFASGLNVLVDGLDRTRHPTPQPS